MIKYEILLAPEKIIELLSMDNEFLKSLLSLLPNSDENLSYTICNILFLLIQKVKSEKISPGVVLQNLFGILRIENQNEICTHYIYLIQLICAIFEFCEISDLKTINLLSEIKYIANLVHNSNDQNISRTKFIYLATLYVFFLIFS